MMISDTIAAIATALTNSGIGIIRISGEAAFDIAEKIFKPVKKEKKISQAESYTAHYGYIVDGGETVDEVILLLMRGPHSYTAEDTVEIDCHGGVVVMRRILQLVIRNGARLAEPGEFTKRAFLNGRIDLSQAEAVSDVIQAKNEYALKSSESQLRGSLSRKVRELRERLLYEIAFIESALDDPEHISLEGYPERLSRTIFDLKGEIKRALATFDSGRVLKEGIKTVILGKPNAGKSSLMNVLVGEERAIVTDVAGTTRDVLEENVRLHGISLNIVDTAGIRETADVVEKIGVEKARKMADESDLILYVIDGSRPLDEDDKRIMELIRDRRAIFLLNKTDLELVLSAKEVERETGQTVIPISAREERGIELLEEKIKEMFFQGEINFNDEILLTNIRHKSAMEEAYESLTLVEKSIDDQMPEDFFSIDLMNAYEQLGTIIGEALEEDLINKIFKEFCMGK